MKSALSLVFAAWIPVHVSPATAVDEAAVPQDGGAVVENDPAALVRDLSNESFKVREKATLEIWKLGESALPQLREAAASRDPERAIRAREILRKVQLHITPDTDPSIIELVERYNKTSSAEEKQELLGKMRGKRAWRQMLKLFATETSAGVRERLQPLMSGIAVRAARERLLLGDAKGAREYLELAPADAAGLSALAEFHRTHGTLDAEIERARQQDHPNSNAWLLALYRSAGDLESARRAAMNAKETRVAASLSALMGDPLPWLRLAPSEEQSTLAGEVYRKVAAKQWQGGKIRASDLEPLMKGLASRNSILRENSMSSLFLLGENAAAEAAFLKANAFEAFRHFETLERIPEAVKALGLDADEPDYKSWVASRMKYLTNEDIEDQHEVLPHSDQIASLANYLERRGLHEQAWDAFSEPLSKLAEKDSDVYLELLGALFGTSQTLKGAPKLARRSAAEWAGDDPARWDDVVASAFGDEDATREWWAWLEELGPESARTERLDAMLALYGLCNDPNKLRRKWLGLAWDSLENAGEGARREGVRRIFELSATTGDVRNALRAWDAMDEETRADMYWERMLVFFSAEDRWGDAAEMILKQMGDLAEANHDAGANLHAYAAAALRMAGREEEAAKYDEWVEKLTLGNPVLALQAGNAYAFGRDYVRAATWWARGAILADPEAREFPLAIKLHSDHLLEQGKWLEAAATSEVLAAIYSAADYRLELPLAFLRQRLQADMTRAFSILGSDRKRAISILERCHRAFISDGSLADHFFPGLRKMGLTEEHDRWFDETWQRMEKIIATFPESDNTRNTAAWFASRALRKLDEGEKHLNVALTLNPDQPAYLDTMAEIHFARGDRKKALEWSQFAISFAPDDTQLRRQHERFRSEPLPQ